MEKLHSSLMLVITDILQLSFMEKVINDSNRMVDVDVGHRTGSAPP